jgi:hypothetical protein
MRPLNSPAVIRPVQERLALAPPAGRVARLAMFPDLRDVALHRLPATDLAGVLLGHPPAQVVAAIPLEPAARIVRMFQPFLRHSDKGWLASTPK